MNGYWAKVQRFSYNARLYLLHIIGMDMIHGTWGVIFNLYLLAIGKSIEFVGLRILISSIAAAVTAIPAGMLSDRLGRRASFILGDGIGAAIALLSIMTTNDILLLTLPVIGALFGNMHGVAEPAFMAENSEAEERVHLFSVGSALRTLSAAVGMLLAGWLPVLATQYDKVEVYRWSTFAGIALWFLSLVPALLLREIAPAQTGASRPAQHKTSVFGRLRSPMNVFGLVLMSGFLTLGYSFVGSLMNVWFHEGVHAHEHEIGTTFAAGNLALVVVYFFAPVLADKLGRFNAIFWTRLISLPFMALMALSPAMAVVDSHGHSHAHEVGAAVGLAGLAYVLRTVLSNLSGPIFEAFSMEILDPQERATYVGVSMAVGAAFTAGGGYLGARLMDGGDYQTGFLIWAACYAVALGIFWLFFRRYREGIPGVTPALPGD
ncbi:MAG: MFS transporter [Bacillota bacterium]